MRRILFVLVTTVFCAALILLEARVDRRSVVALERAAQSVSSSGQSARLYVDLGPEAEPKTLQVRVNQEDVTSRFRFTRGGASGLVDGLRPGENEITVMVRDRDDAPHLRRLELETPAVRKHGDLTAELRETTRNLLLSERERARASNTPVRRLAELGREGALALSRAESAGETGRNAEGEVARATDLVGEVDAQVNEVRRYYAKARQRLSQLGLDDKLDRLEAIEQAVVTAAESMSEALALARSGEPGDLRQARRRMEGIAEEPPVPLGAPPRHLVPLQNPDDPRSPFQIYLEAIGGLDFLAGGDPATLLVEPVPVFARNPRRPDRISVGVPTAWAQAGDPDLDPGTGVDFDPLDPDDPIMLKAAELGSDPVAIYEFVYNEIEYELYSGLARGAKATLLRRAGNGPDQAALLIALLRASGYKARFVFGGILADVERVKSWLNVRSWEGAERLLSANGVVGAIGIPPYTDAGEEAVFLDTMIWVKALVPYGPDRGRSLDAPLRWVFLDPSFKTHEMQAGIDLPDIPFDFAHTGAGILNGVNRLTALEVYADAVRANLRAGHSNQTIADMGVRGPIERVELGMLPPTLPYRPVHFHAEFADLDELPFVPLSPPGDIQPQDWMARRYIVELRDLDGTTVRLNHEIRAADFSDTRVTIGWKGATPADQTLIDNDCQGDVAMCPNPGLIDVVPIVKYDGIEQAAGTDPLTLASTVRVFVANVDAIHFRNCFISSGGDPDVYLFTNPCYYNEQAPLVVGARFLLAYDVSQNSQPLIDKRALQLVETYQALGAAHPGEIDFPLTEDMRDDVIGELLFIASLRYGQRFDELARLLEDTDKLQVLKQGRGQSQSLMDVYYLDGTPISIVPAGLLIDILYTSDVYGIDTVEDGVRRAKAFQLLGYTGSALEHQLWEELTQFESVSTIKGLQWVRDNPGFGATIVELDSPGDPIPPLLPTNIRTRIQQELNSGHRVLVPDRELTIELWTGVIYLSELLSTDPADDLGLLFAITTTGIAKGGIAIGLDPWIYEPPRSSAIGANDFLIRLGDPINAASGNMDHSAVDLEVATRGERPVRLERVYNSQFQEVGPFGFGWTHSYNHYLEAIDDDADGNPGEPEDEDGTVSGVAVVDGKGGVRRFRAVTGALDGSFAAEPGNRDVLLAAGGDLERLEPNGTRWRFQGFGASANVGDRRRLDWVEDRNANRTTLQYAGSELSTVTDPLGRQLSFTYSGGVITDVSDWSGRSWAYLYQGNDLTEVRDPIDGPLSRATWRYEYYANQLTTPNDHNMRRYEDANGNGMTFYYYQNDKAYKQVDDEAAETRLSYDVFRLETIEIDALGHRKLYQYDDNGNLKRLVREDGAVEDYVYDAGSRLLTSLVDPYGNTTSYSYDSFGNVKTRQTPEGALETFTYWYEENPGEPVNSPLHNRVVQEVDANGNVRRFDYDAQGNITLETLQMDIGGSPTTVELRRNEYDAFGNRTKAIENIDPATPATNEATDRVTQMVYDALNQRPVQIIDALGGVTENVWDTDLAEPDRGLLRILRTHRVADYPSGEHQVVAFERTFQYDLLARPTIETNPIGSTVSVSRDPGGRVTHELVVGDDGAGGFASRTTVFAFDRADRRAQVTDPEGGVTRFEYDLLGNLVKEIDPNGNASRFEYDERGNQVRLVDPSGGEVRFVRDALGRVIEQIDALGNATRSEYDAEGRVVQVTDPDGGVASFAYDPNGNQIGRSDARANALQTPVNADGFTETRVYDELDRVILIRDAVGGETELALDLLGHPDIVRDAESHEVAIGYDRLGRMTRRTNALGREELFYYDSLGNLIARQDPLHQVAKLYYNFDDLQVSIVFEDGIEHAFGFDGFGNRILARSPAVTYTATYDGLGRPLRRTDSRLASAHRFTYDAVGNLLSFTDLEGSVTQYRHDAAGRVTGISTPDGGEVERHYDAAGYLVAQYFSSGASSSFAHTAAGRIESVEHRSSLGTVLSTQSYTYDENGNRTGVQPATGNPETYEYDALDRLTRVLYPDLSEQTFDYDGVGNRTHEVDRGTQRWLQYDAGNQLLQISADAAHTNPLRKFWYRDNGTLLVSYTPGFATWQSMDYDAADQLVAVDDESGGAWSHEYDALGQRVRQVAPEKTRDYTWMGGNRVAEYEAGSQVGRFTYGPGLDDLVQVVRGGTVGHVHRDALGSVSGISDPGGTQLVSYGYDAFGLVNSASGTFENDLGFTAREVDSNGLMYYRARFYDPKTGRFLNPDPIGFQGGINFYAYAFGNPTTFIDPTGKIVFLPLITGGIGAAGAAAGAWYSGASNTEIAAAAIAGGIAGATGGFLLVVGAQALIGAGVTAAGVELTAAGAGVVSAAGTVAGGVGSAVVSDIVVQGSMMSLNPQRDFDWGRTGVAAVGALAASPLAAVPAFSTGVATSLYGTNSLAVASGVAATPIDEAIIAGIIDFGIGAGVGELFAPDPRPAPAAPPIANCIKGLCF